MPRTLRDWKPGDALKADHWQELVDALRELSLRADAYQLAAGPQPQRRFVVLTITNQGPNGEADWANNAYWAKISYIAGGTQGADLTINPDLSEYPPDDEEAGGPAEPVTVVAYNQSEEPDLTHTVPTDGTVHVIAWVIDDYGDPSRTRYLFAYGGGAKLLWGTLTADWSPGDNVVTLQPCKAYNDPTSLKQADGTTPVATILNVYIQLPTTALTPCFQPLVADNKPLGYKTEGGISYLVNPQLWPRSSHQYETIIEMSANPAVSPHWVNSYPLIHN